MDIRYLSKFTSAFNKMTENLFKPFDLGKWFTVGFTAFLAMLTSIGGFYAGNPVDDNNGANFKIRDDFPEVKSQIFNIWEWLTNHPVWFFSITVGLFVFLVVFIILKWLSSRGKFMFIHNVVNDTALIKKPWKEYKNEGNSLFIWRIIFGIICLLLASLFLLVFFIFLFNIKEMDFYNTALIWHFFLFGFSFIFFIIIANYFYLFFDSFVVPLMYKHKIGVIGAWKKFLKIFSKYPLAFILYGVLYVVANIIFSIVIIALGFSTCCMFFFLSGIPYIGDVVTLPINYTKRLFCIEFISQFGEEYKILK